MRRWEGGGDGGPGVSEEAGYRGEGRTEKVSHPLLRGLGAHPRRRSLLDIILYFLLARQTEQVNSRRKGGGSWKRRDQGSSPILLNTGKSERRVAAGEDVLGTRAVPWEGRAGGRDEACAEVPCAAYALSPRGWGDD